MWYLLFVVLLLYSKIVFSVKLLQELNRLYHKDFEWKLSATSHGKSVVDCVGGKAKSLVRAKVTSKARNENKLIVQIHMILLLQQVNC